FAIPSGWFDNALAACYHSAAAQGMILFHQCCVEAQGMLIGVMSNHNREVDEIDYLLRDALRSNRDAVRNVERILAALRAQVVGERWPAHTVWSLSTQGWTSWHMSGSYWYLAPLARGIR